MECSEVLIAMAGSTRNEHHMLKEKQPKKCRLLIFERDSVVRDKCAGLAASLDCDLYSTTYIDNFEKVVRRFEPSGIVIDAGLFDNDSVELLRAIAEDAPDVKLLFLAGDDSEFDENAESLARSVGLHVEGLLRRPISDALLKESIRRIA